MSREIEYAISLLREQARRSRAEAAAHEQDAINADAAVDRLARGELSADGVHEVGGRFILRRGAAWCVLAPQEVPLCRAVPFDGEADIETLIGAGPSRSWPVRSRRIYSTLKRLNKKTGKLNLVYSKAGGVIRCSAGPTSH